MAELSERLGASKGSLRTWLERAHVPAYSFGRPGRGPGGASNTKIFYRRSDITDWLAASREAYEEPGELEEEDFEDLDLEEEDDVPSLEDEEELEDEDDDLQERDEDDEDPEVDQDGDLGEDEEGDDEEDLEDGDDYEDYE